MLDQTVPKVARDLTVGTRGIPEGKVVNSFQFTRSARLILAYPTSGRRTMLPIANSQITDSPYFHPRSLWAIAPVPAGCPQLETVGAVSAAHFISSPGIN